MRVCVRVRVLDSDLFYSLCENGQLTLCELTNVRRTIMAAQSWLHRLGLTQPWLASVCHTGSIFRTGVIAHSVAEKSVGKYA